MRVLVIGGTVFVGRYIVEALLSQGHDVTLFHRGTSGAGLFPDCPRIHGDRIEDIGKAASQQWDAVIDSSAYFPRQVRAVAAALADKTDFCAFISTISVYDQQGQEAFDENTPLLPIGDPLTEQVTGETYGYLKILCEQEIEKSFGGRNVIVRPGLVFGPHDPTGRFPYWVQRISQEPEVLVPDSLDQVVQFIDTRDLGEFMARLVSERTTGVYNATGPRVSFGKLINEIANQSGNAPVQVIATEANLEKVGLKMWQDLPLVLPRVEGNPSRAGVFDFSNAKASENGLTLRSYQETVRATLEWIQTEGLSPAKYGISREEELNAIERLRAQSLLD